MRMPLGFIKVRLVTVAWSAFIDSRFIDFYTREYLTDRTSSEIGYESVFITISEYLEGNMFDTDGLGAFNLCSCFLRASLVEGSSTVVTGKIFPLPLDYVHASLHFVVTIS